MIRLLGAGRVIGTLAIGLLIAISGNAIGRNYGPMMLQNLGADLDPADLAAFRANIGVSGAAINYTPINKAGDSFTGLAGFTVSATVSAAGSTQGTATPIMAQMTDVTTVATNAGVVLNSTIGVPQTIYNHGLNVLSVYPFVGAAVDTYGTNVAVGIAVNGMATFRCVSTTLCRVGG